MRDTVVILASSSSCARRLFNVACMLVAKVSSPEPKRMLILGGGIIGKTIHPHPMLGESIGMAAEIALGSCTDAPPAGK